MKEFCREQGLNLKETGKVVVARNESELESVYELKRRADRCGARAFLVDGKELAEIEPHAATFGRALFSPDTSVVSPQEVLKALAKELVQSGRVRIWHQTAFRAVEGERRVRTSKGTIRFEMFVNAAGAYADKVAHSCGLAQEYNTLPFKGTYRKQSRSRAFLVRGNIYPVPDLRNPFLGVHLTRSVDGEVYVGPTAIPALGRESYGLLDGLDWETVAILFRMAVMLVKNDAFRRVALTEARKYLTRFIFEEAARLVPELTFHDLVSADKVGIRPQLVHWPSKRLAMDFVLFRDGASIHILNAVSPAFTSSMAFAKHVVATLLGDRGEKKHAV
jgi:L-2-hydroxyglutarate oxidase LhgO